MLDDRAPERTLWQEGREAWSDVEVPFDSFLRYLAEIVDGTSKRDNLGRGKDLYLACAIASRAAGADRAFRDRVALPHIQRLVARNSKIPSSCADDLCQRLVPRLLRRLAEYRGEVRLSSFVAVSAAREARHLLLQIERRQEVPLIEGGDLPSALNDFPVSLVRMLARSQLALLLQEAMKIAVDRLPAKRRDALHRLVVRGHSQAEIGRALGVHADTIGRWHMEFAARTSKEMRRLAKRRSLRTEELNSLIAYGRSQLDLNLREILKRPMGGQRRGSR